MVTGLELVSCFCDSECVTHFQEFSGIFWFQVDDEVWWAGKVHDGTSVSKRIYSGVTLCHLQACSVKKLCYNYELFS